MEEMQPVVESKKMISPVIILAVVAVVIVALIVYASHKSTTNSLVESQGSGVDENGVPLNYQTLPSPDTTTTPTPVATAPTPAPTTTAKAATFKNGTYSAAGNYMAPSGQEHINVTLTLKDGVVTDSKVVATATSEYSSNMQDVFIANYKTLVIGKKITDINLGKVSGSSLTPIGFNDAVAKIEVQAAA